MPEVVRHIGFFRSWQPEDAPGCERSSGATKERLAEAVLNNKPDAMDRLCACMVPLVYWSTGLVVFWSARVILEEMRTQWADIRRHGHRNEFLAYAIERLPAIAAVITPSLEWRRDENLEEVARAVLDGDDGPETVVMSSWLPGSATVSQPTSWAEKAPCTIVGAGPTAGGRSI